MDLLHLQLFGTQLAFPMRQVQRVCAWPVQVSFPVRGLAQALGLGPAPEGSGHWRLLEVSGGGAHAGFLLPSTAPLVHRVALAGALFRLPALLGRLGPPSWLAGVLSGEVPSLIVDLERLALLACTEVECRT